MSVMSSPSKIIFPESLSVIPRMIFRSVVLPLTDEPSIETISPSFIARSIPSSTVTPSYDFFISFKSSILTLL